MFEYDALAKYYDLFDIRTIDIQFWKEMARQLGGPILELSCGTGRLTFPIAEECENITGIDLSKKMLTIAKKKLKEYPKTIQHKINLIHGNTIQFNIKNKFRTIFCPEAFWAVTDAEQASMMESIKSHLEPGGHLVMSISNFHERTEDIKFQHLKLCKYYPQYGFTVTRQNFVEGKKGTRTDRIIHFLDRIYENGTIKRIVTERVERQRSKQELAEILTTYGFEIQEVYGEYDKTVWSSDTKWIIVVARLLKNTPFNRLKILINNRLS